MRPRNDVCSDGGERRQNAFQSLGRIRGIQTGKDQVAGFRSFQNHFDGFPIAQFADQDHLRRLSQRRPHRQGKVRRIAVQLSLVDGGLLVIVQKFDGIFDGDDMASLLFVDAVQQSRQGGRFSRTARPGHQNNSVPQTRYFSKLSRQAQGGEFRHRGWNHPHDHRAAAALDEYIHPKAGQPRQAEGDIAGPVLAQHIDGLLVVSDEIGGDAASVVRAEDAQSRTLHRHELPVDFHLGRASGREDQVADLFSRSQHGRQQGMRGSRAGTRCRLKRDLKRCCRWSCHFSLSQKSGVESGRRFEPVRFARFRIWFNCSETDGGVP